MVKKACHPSGGVDFFWNNPIIFFLPEKASLKEEVATITCKQALYLVSHESIKCERIGAGVALAACFARRPQNFFCG